MRSIFQRLLRQTDGAVAPVVALSLIGLVAIGGVAFDYAHLAAMDTELQQAADQAALAGATQLDGQIDAIARATAAAQSLIKNKTLLAGDGSSNDVTVPTITFCSAFDDSLQDTSTACTVTTDDSKAKVVWVKVGGRTATYSLTPVVGLFNSGTIGAEAVASLSSAICKTPPVMMCNPAESNTNTDVSLPYNPTRGIGLRLITGDATVPGNFGWLQALDASGNPISGANNLKEELGYNTPIGACQSADSVTTKTGMDTTVIDAFNSRFDVYANGNTCPGSGTCSPALNDRKDLVCAPNNSNSACRSNATWAEASKPYHPTSTTPLPTDASQDPSTIGYPMDLCHAIPKANNTCGVVGDGNWDRDAYFRVNYGWDHATWVAQLGNATPSRFDVYTWEQAHQSVSGKGMAVPKIISGSEAAFSYPATGTPGVGTPDRRRISIAVVNCHAIGLKGQTSGVPVVNWIDSFLVQPAFQRGPNAPSQIYTDQKDIYVEVIGSTSVGQGNAQLVRRDRPYLMR
jgi:Flp pilus assembly protein TadG